MLESDRSPGNLVKQMEELVVSLEQEIACLGAKMPGENSPELSFLREHLQRISGLIGRTRDEVAGLSLWVKTHSGSVADTLGAVSGADEQAVQTILSGMERVQEVTSRLRTNPSVSITDIASIEMEVVAVMLACSYQDLSGQRLKKVVQTLGYLEDRTRMLEGMWVDQSAQAPEFRTDDRPDAHLMNGPSADGLSQAEMDRLLGEPQHASQNDIDNLFD